MRAKLTKSASSPRATPAAIFEILRPLAAKPKLDQLLIRSALEPALLRKFCEAPDSVLDEFDLSDEERDILRAPDHRLLPLLGAALHRDSLHKPADEVVEVSPAPLSMMDGPPPIIDAPPTVIDAKTLPSVLMLLTVVPCATPAGIQYAVWVNPMAEGADTSSAPLPPGAVLPGQPLTPLHAVIELSAVQSQSVEGQPQVGLWASLRQASNVTAAPPAETLGDPDVSPFGSALDSEEVREAADAVRAASADDRYQKLVDLMRTLRRGDVR